jgi:hypothetical protein
MTVWLGFELAGVKLAGLQAGLGATLVSICHFSLKDPSQTVPRTQPDGASCVTSRLAELEFPTCTPQSAREVEITKPMSVIKIEQKTINQSEKKTGSRYTFQKLVRRTNFRGLLGSLLGVSLACLGLLMNRLDRL